MTQLDLLPAAERLILLTAGVGRDDPRPTPCPELPVSALLAHVRGLAIAFRAAALKSAPDPSPPDDAGDLDRRLRDMARAWHDAAAWEGMTNVGGLDLPGELAGRVALGELVTHGWDLARAIGRPFTVPDVELDVVDRTYRELRNGNDGDLPGLFGKVVDVDARAALLDRVVALAGRDPNWAAGNR